VDFKSCLVNNLFLPKKGTTQPKPSEWFKIAARTRGAKKLKKADWLMKLRKKRHRIASEHARYFSRLKKFNMADGLLLF